MSSRLVFRPLCCLVFGHQPIIEINEGANKAEYVCERCRAVLGDFVTNLRKPRLQPVKASANGVLAHAPLSNGLGRPKPDTELAKSVDRWRDDGGRG